MPSANLLRRLKDTTARVHRRVEERVNVFSAGFDLPRYIGLLRHFYGFWEPIEANLKRLPELRNPALALDERLKAHLLEMDLRRFHVDPTLVDRCPQLPQLHTSSQGLGCMYVLEGSTLGSKFIARRLAEHLSIDSGSGAAFFNAYGEETGARWAQFRDILTSHTDSSNDELVCSAVETFQCLDSWLASGYSGHNRDSAELSVR